MSDIKGPVACSRAIAVAGKDVYVTGAKDGNDRGRLIAAYWKNGKATILAGSGSTTHRNGYAEAIAVSNSNVYIAGEETNGRYNVATCWTNGKPTQLGDGKHYSAAYAITVVRR